MFCCIIAKKSPRVFDPGTLYTFIETPFWTEICSTTRSPLLFNGYPRVLLSLVFEFDSHRGDIFDFFAETQKIYQLR